MTTSMFDNGKHALLTAGINFPSDTMKAMLVDQGYPGVILTITNATNANPIQITTPGAHGLTTGNCVSINGVGGNTAANGLFYVTVVDSTHFTLDGSTGSGAYTSGGTAFDLTNKRWLSDIPSGARVATTTLTTCTATNGVLNADPAVFTAVAGASCELVIVYKDTGTESTSPLFILYDSIVGFPFSPSGGNVRIEWPTDSKKMGRI
ncbi:MAG: hypothetical protein HQL73_02730 [Magnetococcales bacterium]|nr:hypothetical protein [Magnetococcales bacterium]